jgi:hypothetical protein
MLSEVWKCARPTGGSHGLTTEAFTLLISIGILLEIPKGPEPESPAPIGQDRRRGMLIPPGIMCVVYAHTGRRRA